MVSPNRLGRLAASGMARRIVRSIRSTIKRLKRGLRIRSAIREIEGRPRSTIPPRRRGRSAEHLIVSLTSYPRRFPTLHLTLKSLLRQTVPADKVILWLEPGDDMKLPDDVLALQSEGLEIATHTAMRSYLKIVPTLISYPGSTIITADDDIYYGASMIENLLAAHQEAPDRIICNRAHEIRLNRDGAPLPYLDWQRNLDAPQTSRLVFPTGVMGVLYPPGVFHPDVTNEALFKQLSPTADDVWLYWMWRLTGKVASKIGNGIRLVEWPETQASHLRTQNVDSGGNDLSVRNMIDECGFPV